jgi:beta-lactamase regulating signal transducer with metallopeptidase domain
VNAGLVLWVVVGLILFALVIYCLLAFFDR